MIWIYALIDRLLLLGFASSLVFGIYLLLRNWLKLQMSGRIRQFSWMVVLLLPFLAIPWPQAVAVPASTPSWIYTGRLPDLAVPYPDVNRIITVSPTGQNQLQGTARTGDPDADPITPSVRSMTTEVLPHGSFPWLWYLRRQNLIRSLWLVTTVLYLLMRLYQSRKGGRGQGRALPAIALTSDDWLQELAQARDAMGLYRRGQLLLLTGKLTFSQSIQLALRKAILLPEGSDQIVDAKDRQWLLQQAIIQQRHPDIQMSLLYRFERFWRWLWPAGWISGQIYQEDRQIWQTERLTRRLVSKTARQPSTAKAVAATAIVILFLILPVLALWQNPLYLWPDMEDAINKHAIAWSEVNRLNLQHDGVSDTYYLWASYYGHLAGPGQITSYIDGSETGIQMLDQTGLPAWRLRLDERLAVMWPHPEPDQSDERPEIDDVSDTFPDITIELTGQQELADDNYLLTARILRISYEPRTILLQVTKDGNLLNYAQLGDIVSAATGEPIDYRVDYAYQTVLMHDGDLVIVWKGVSSTNSDDGQPDHEYFLSRIREGTVLWKVSLDDLQAAGLNLFRYEDSSMIWQRSIKQCFPANDGGLFLVINDYMALRNDKATPVLASMLTYTTYPLTNQIARIKPDGTLDWIMPVGDNELPVTILDVEHADNDRLYLAAQVQYRQPVLHASKATRTAISYITSYYNPYDNGYAKGSLIVLDGTDGREAWRQDYYASPWSLAAQVLIQDETVTVLYQYDPYGNRLGQLEESDEAPPGLSCETICQYDSNGRLIGYAILPKATGQQDWDYIFIRPGDVILPTSKQPQGLE
ncbi:MAG: hypothetical protein SCM11_12245 [Bacillota bacterium]|nr:hypothetical protein [Bacillota bacterium]